MCACIIWATDTWNSIPTAVTGIGAVLVLYAPYIGAIDFHKVTRFTLLPSILLTPEFSIKIGTIRWPLLLFMIGVLALGTCSLVPFLALIYFPFSLLAFFFFFFFFFFCEGNALGANSQMQSISGDALGWWIGLTDVLFLRYYLVVLLMLPINWVLGG
mgnify:CR=1 FL=1